MVDLCKLSDEVWMLILKQCHWCQTISFFFFLCSSIEIVVYFGLSEFIIWFFERFDTGDNSGILFDPIQSRFQIYQRLGTGGNFRTEFQTHKFAIRCRHENTSNRFWNSSNTSSKSILTGKRSINFNLFSLGLVAFHRSPILNLVLPSAVYQSLCQMSKPIYFKKVWICTFWV